MCELCRYIIYLLLIVAAAASAEAAPAVEAEDGEAADEADQQRRHHRGQEVPRVGGRVQRGDGQAGPIRGQYPGDGDQSQLSITWS